MSQPKHFEGAHQPHATEDDDYDGDVDEATCVKKCHKCERMIQDGEAYARIEVMWPLFECQDCMRLGRGKKIW